MELKDYVRIVLAHWLGVLLLAVAGVAGAVAYNVTQPKVYEATATGYVTAGASNNTSEATLADSLAKAKVTSYVAVATSTKVADRVISTLGLQTTPAVLIGDIKVGQPTGTVLLDISARDGDPAQAQRLADAWVTALAAEIKTLDTGGQSTTTSGSAGTDGLHIETLSQASPGSLVLPRTKLNLLAGLVLGLLLGLAYALVRHQFDRRLRSTEEVQKRFGIPVIGTIPTSSQMRHQVGGALALAVTGTAESSSASTAEGFRKLRTNLAYMDVDQPPRVIVVTSPKQSDGKSTVAANLAAAIAIGGQPVTLIDGDLRRPTVAGSLSLVDGAGLTDVLVGRVKPAEVMQDHPDVPGLQVLASGAIPPNPSELLGSNAMRTLIGELAQDAMVIIDAPPLLPVTDAAVLTRSADGAIVVVSHRATLDSELAASLAHITAVHGRTLGIVFNRMRRTAASGFYGGDYDRYEYKPETNRRRIIPRRQKEKTGSTA
jgi:capsular exopolysaccharide synthesis family protein